MESLIVNRSKRIDPVGRTIPVVPGVQARTNDHDRLRAMVERRLAELVPTESCSPEVLHRAMRYSLLAGGKRIRPVMTLLTATHLGGSEEQALDPACAIELIHTASLILDDMPCMDDATLRRSKPANHLVFGEDTAALASMALLNRAYGVLAESEGVDSAVRVELIRLVSEAIGSDGIIAGQFVDLRGGWQGARDPDLVLEMYAQKTGALFVAAVETGARIARVEESWVAGVREFAVKFGLAFQIYDDLLDRFARECDAGKDVGQDDCKPTLVSFIGAENASHEASNLMHCAAQALEPLGTAGQPLVDLLRAFEDSAAGMARTP